MWFKMERYGKILSRIVMYKDKIIYNKGGKIDFIFCVNLNRFK